MRLLRELGLINPRIELIRYPFNDTMDIVLEADNKHKTKNFLYINSIFKDFLSSEIKKGMEEDIKNTLKSSNPIITDDTNVRIELINYIEISFENYLKESHLSLAEFLKEIEIETPNIKFIKINNPLFIKFSEDDIKNGYCFFMSFSKSTAKRIGVDNYITYEPKLKNCIERICFNNRKDIKCYEINVYYHILSDERLAELEELKPNKQWYKALRSGFLQATLIATNPSTKIKKPKKEISLHWILEENKDFNQNLIK